MFARYGCLSIGNGKTMDEAVENVNNVFEKQLGNKRDGRLEYDKLREATAGIRSEIARSDVPCYVLVQINCQDLPACLCQEATYLTSNVTGGSRDKDHRFVVA